MTETRFTPGPWYWGGAPECLRLTAAHSGQRFVMTFERKGMQGAQPLFQPKNGMVPADQLLKFAVGDKSVTGEQRARSDESVYRYDVVAIDAPDAHLIAAAPELYACTDPFDNWCRFYESNYGELSGNENVSIRLTIGELRAIKSARAKARGET